MPRTPAKLRDDAERIWRAGVLEVQPERLIPQHVQVAGDELVVGDRALELARIRRVVVVGAGKASAAMTVALEAALGERLLAEKRVQGWVNVPADCLVPTRHVHLHPARPAGVNEPRQEGVDGTPRILELVSSLGSDDVCFCLLSGGGSALLPAPAPGITLTDKIHVAQRMSSAGANITQLNTVRAQLSRVKGGGLARACRGGRMFSLIISDVLGDPLDLIASGPTVRSRATPAEALALLHSLGLGGHPDLRNVEQYFRKEKAVESAIAHSVCEVTNLVIGNNAVAVDAAGCAAERLGYSHAMISATAPEGPAEDVGRHLAEMIRRMRNEAGPNCLISGGEPTVRLVDAAERGRGGRNQQLALAALADLGDCQDFALLAAGTDGEDGPTDAAGAFVTPEIIAQGNSLGLDPANYLRRNDAYTYFDGTNGLFKTGPTHTNVCDLRVVVTQSHHH